jgi:hypothetical protein
MVATDRHGHTRPSLDRPTLHALFVMYYISPSRLSTHQQGSTSSSSRSNPKRRSTASKRSVITTTVLKQFRTNDPPFVVIRLSGFGLPQHQWIPTTCDFAYLSYGTTCLVRDNLPRTGQPASYGTTCLVRDNLPRTGQPASYGTGQPASYGTSGTSSLVQDKRASYGTNTPHTAATHLGFVEREPPVERKSHL